MTQPARKPDPLPVCRLVKRWEVVDADGRRRTVYKALGATLLEMRRQYPGATVRALE